jgi:hypothetical protein
MPYTSMKFVKQDEREFPCRGGVRKVLVVTFRLLEDDPAMADAPSHLMVCDVPSDPAYLTRAAYGIKGRDPAAPLQAVALVIGIQNYEGTRGLKNTLSDAKAVAAKFEGMGFDVMSLTDENAEGGKVDQLQMEDKIEAFIEKVDENTIAAFAYMGASAKGPCSLGVLPVYCLCACARVCEHFNR